MSSASPPRLVAICATPPHFNPGMHSVDWALDVFLRRHGLNAQVDRRALYTPQELHQQGLGGSRNNFELPWSYRSLRDADAGMEDADAILFWGDFLHSHSHREELAEILCRCGIAASVHAGIELFDRFLFLRDFPDAVLMRTILFGQCLLTEPLHGPPDEAFERQMGRLMQNAHGVWMRDALSAQRAAIRRNGAGPSPPGIDCALLLHPEDYWGLGAAPPRPRARGGVFFGRTHHDPGLLLGFASRVCAELGVEPTWLPWFSAAAMSPEVIARHAPEMARPRLPETMAATLSALLECDYVITDCYHLCVHAWNNGIPAVGIGKGASRFKTSVSDKKKELFFLTYDAGKFYVFAEQLEEILTGQPAQDPWGWTLSRDVAPAAVGRLASYLADKRVTTAVQARIASHRDVVEPQLRRALASLLDSRACGPRRSATQTKAHHQLGARACSSFFRRSLYRLAPALIRSHLDYRQVIAVIATYNEGDIIYHSLRKLIDTGIGVHLIDNWSTDDSFEQIQPLIGRGVLAYERFPREGPTPYFSLRHLLERAEQVCQASGAEWTIHQDVDEIRCSPWPGVSLREGLERVAREGFNTVDHVVLRFRPINNSFPYGGDMERHFKWFSFDRHPSHMRQRKAWRTDGVPFSLAATAGHSIEFEGQRVFPHRFLLKHYPIRSQAHGERKVLRERKPRFDPQERAIGWHVHYDEVNAITNFLADPGKLERYHPYAVRKKLLEHPVEADERASFL